MQDTKVPANTNRCKIAVHVAGDARECSIYW